MMMLSEESRRLLAWAGAFVVAGMLASPALAQTIGDPGTAPPAGGAPIGGTGGGGAAPAQSPFGGTFLLLMVGLMVFMIVTTIMSGRRQKKERERLLTSLKKHDRVQTHGGIIGSIVELKDTEVVLKVDAANNTRITFAKSAVQQVLQPSPASASSSSE